MVNERRGDPVIKEVLLVDGYNIIHAWQELKVLAGDSLSHARDALLDILSNYQGYKKNEIIVVFDAYRTTYVKRHIQTYKNIHVVFTKEAETADTYIETVIHMYGRDYQIRVATSDGLEQVMVMAKGGVRMSARELYQDVQSITQVYAKDFVEQETKSTNRLENHLDASTKAWMEKLRRGK